MASTNITSNNQTDNIENFSDLFERASSNIKEGNVVKGKIIKIEKDLAIIDIGMKSEGRIPLSEFEMGEEKEQVNIGDEVDVLVESFEDRGGVVVLSRERALRNKIWNKFEKMYNEGLNIEGQIIGRVKGGFAVELGGIIAFLPGSQVDIRLVKDISALTESPQPFKILKMDREHGNMVVSRRAILEDSRKEARETLLSSIKEGMVLQGTVKNITGYGAFIDLKATDGLLHITDISWSKIAHPSDVLSVGQVVKVMVIKYSPETQRISLGLKQLERNPWENIKNKYAVGTKHKGKVMSITDYGAFVALEDNVDGLVYHTEINWSVHNLHPSKLLNVGDEVEVMILDIDISRHRISLSIKQCKPNPWKIFAEKSPIGTKIDAVVKNVTDFGIFVIRAQDSSEDYPINILIPSGELSWNTTPEDALKSYHKGDNISCVVTNVNIERERITASIKQLQEDAKSVAIEKLMSSGSIITGTVSEVNKDNLYVDLGDAIIANVERNELSKHKDEQNTRRFNDGDKVEVKLISFNKQTRELIASIRAAQIEREAEVIKEFGDEGNKANLGDILNPMLNKKL